MVFNVVVVQNPKGRRGPSGGRSVPIRDSNASQSLEELLISGKF